VAARTGTRIERLARQETADGGYGAPPWTVLRRLAGLLDEYPGAVRSGASEDDAASSLARITAYRF
jgi:hypothetical protein